MGAGRLRAGDLESPGHAPTPEPARLPQVPVLRTACCVQELQMDPLPAANRICVRYSVAEVSLLTCRTPRRQYFTL